MIFLYICNAEWVSLTLKLKIKKFHADGFEINKNTFLYVF